MTRRSRTLAIIAVSVAVGYAVIVGLATVLENRLAFPGARGALPPPARVGLADGQSIFLPSADSVRISGWYLPPNPAPDTGTAPGLVWFHGNRETIDDIAPLISAFRPPGVGLLVIDYRGYGETPGRTTETNAYADAELAFDALVARPEIDPARIAIYGRSIGSAVALELAQRRPAVGVILDSPFTSAGDMGKRHYAFLPTSLGRLRLDNRSNARRLSVPLLVFHGEDDYIAPVEMGREVAAAGGGDIIVFPNAGHNDTYTANPSRYRDALHGFLERVFQTTEPGPDQP